MNLAFGKIIDLKQREKVVGALCKSIENTKKKRRINAKIVIEACDKLAKEIGEQHLAWLKSTGLSIRKCQQYLYEAKKMLGKEYWIRRIEKELGADFEEEKTFETEEGYWVTEARRPIGALLHLVAGNQYALAAYSVIEGLLTGNINLVKLSRADEGLSVFILKKIIEIEPRLGEYVYVFDYPSRDREAIKRLMDAADGIVVWGGDTTVREVRQMAAPNVKVIEWGHKISFAYATREGMTEENLAGLAKNIVSTNQLLCSSCQGIYVDTESMEEIQSFCKKFVRILDACQKDYGEEIPIEIQAQNSIRLYVESLESVERSCKIYRGNTTSVTAYEDSQLELSIMHGNCWVKPLPKRKIVGSLMKYKNYLQTASILSGTEEQKEIAEQLIAAGVVRITTGEKMSDQYGGVAHDGEQPLRRYTKLVAWEKSGFVE